MAHRNGELGTGRTVYCQKIVDELPEMFRCGESVAEVADKIGVTKQTIYDWCRIYPEFKEAFDLGKTLAESWWTKLGREGSSCDAAINSKAWSFNMKNRFGWSEKVEQKLEGEIQVKTLSERWDELNDKQG